MLEHVRNTIIRHKMLAPGDRVLVAVSGGIDSVSLLHVLCQLRDEFSISLAVAHLDHRLRPDSDKDARFVYRLAQSLNLPCFIGRTNVKALAEKERRSSEDAARKARYEFLERVAQDWGAHKLASGHTLNDQVETFFMRLVRGAGLEGLKGIPATRALRSSLTLIRPLIECSRLQIETYAKENRLAYREDPTNKEKHFTRNKVRHELLPWLAREFNPNLYDTIARTQYILARASQFLNSLAEEKLRELIQSEKASSLAIDRRGFKQLDEFLMSLVLRKAFERVIANQTEIGFVHIEKILRALALQKHVRQQLPGAIRLHTRSDLIVISRGKINLPSQFFFSLDVPGETVLAQIGWCFCCEFVSPKTFLRAKKTLQSDSLEAYLDFDTIKGKLCVRNRHPGDRFAPLGLKGKKKLQDFFVDEKIALEERDQVPLVCDERSIAWVLGWRTSHLHRIQEGTRSILKISAVRLEEEAACRL